MDSLKVLHSKAAKIVLNRPTHSSFTQALIDLGWVNLQWIFGFDGAYIDLSIFFFFVVKPNYVLHIFCSKNETRFLSK